jgi:hypothetical protein
VHCTCVGGGHAPRLGHGTDGHGWHEKCGWNEGHKHVLPHVALLTVKHGAHETAVIRSSAMHGWHDTFGCVGGQ